MSPDDSTSSGSKNQARQVLVPPSFFHTLTEFMARREPVVMVTVAEIRGSVPGKLGGKMLVTADAQHGSVGGGAVEERAIQEARALLGERAGPRMMSYELGKDLGMSCGGMVRLFFEPIGIAPRLVLFGAGHVARPVCAVAATAGFEVTVCDEREAWLTSEAFPLSTNRIKGSPEEAAAQAGIDGDTFVAVVTPDQSLDQRAILAVLRGEHPPRYLGVIGSRRKRKKIEAWLDDEGLAEVAAPILHVPMGLDIGAVGPGEIAVSVVAQMAALFRGVEAVEPW